VTEERTLSRAVLFRVLTMLFSRMISPGEKFALFGFRGSGNAVHALIKNT